MAKSVDSILRSILRGGEGMRYADEPTWSKKAERRRDLFGGIAESGIAALQTFGAIKQQDQVNYAREQSTLKTFESRLNNPINNAFADSTIFSNKTLDEVEATMGRMHSDDIRRFPKQEAELTDIYESQVTQLDKYRSLNNHYSYLSSKIPDSKQFLEDMTNRLSTMSWEELTPEAKIQIKKELMEGTQNIATLGKMIANNKDYFKNHETFNRDADDIQIGIIGGYNQLLTQIDTLDPDGNVISKDDLAAMLKTIRSNDPGEMIQRNELAIGFKTDRVTGKAKDFDKAHAEWKGLSAASQDPIFVQERDIAYEEFEKFKIEQDNKLKKGDIKKAVRNKAVKDYFDNPENWSSMTYIDKVTQRGMDVRNTGIQMHTLQRQMDTIDADYVQDTGGEYSKWRGRSTPWRKTEEELDLERKAKLKKDVIAKPGVEDLPETGVGVPTPTGEEPFTVSELHKPVTPEVPTIPTGEKGKSVEERLSARNKEYAKKYNTSVEHIELLRGSYDEDDTAAMDFPSYLNREANAGEFKKLSTEGAPTSPTVGESLYKTHTNKRDTRYGEPVIPLTSKPFKAAQSNLSSIVSDKFSNLSVSEKGKYKGNKKESIRAFVKDKFELWLKESGNLRKANWKTKGKYAVEDFKYFIPTKTDKSGKVSKNPDVNIYTLYYPGAFKKGFPAGIFKTPDNSDDGYIEFVKDFDDFRKYLQES